MSDEISASHILIGYDDDKSAEAGRSQDEAKEKIAALKTEIDGGADFAALAGTHSDCPSARDGGSLGSFSRGSMVEEFDDVVFDLDVGEVSGVVETAFGYHLIQRTE